MNVGIHKYTYFLTPAAQYTYTHTQLIRDQGRYIVCGSLQLLKFC